MEVEAADVEGELRPQHAEEPEDVVRRLGERVRHAVDPPPADVRERPEAVLVAIRDREAVGRGTVRQREPLRPALLARPSHHVAATLVPPSELRAHQDAAPEPQLLEMVLEKLEIVVVELLLEHGEEPHEPVGPEVARMLVRDPAECSEHPQEEVENAHGPLQDVVG